MYGISWENYLPDLGSERVNVLCFPSNVLNFSWDVQKRKDQFPLTFLTHSLNSNSENSSCIIIMDPKSPCPQFPQLKQTTVKDDVFLSVTQAYSG